MAIKFDLDNDFISEKSDNLETLEVNQKDKRVTGRTSQLTIKITPAFHQELRTTAFHKKMLITEIIEESYKVWKKELEKKK